MKALLEDLGPLDSPRSRVPLAAMVGIRDDGA